VEVAPLGAIPDAFVCTPRQHADDRGVFLEWYKADPLAAAVGHRLALEQANHSVSRRGTLRGLHYADVPPGQAKYVYCPVGAALDVVVDLRVGSPSFGAVETLRLDAVDRRGVYVPEGLGHAFLSLAEDTAVTYLCSTNYTPSAEHGVDPLDPALGLPWPSDVEPLLSGKDAAAPTLAQALERGLLPSYDVCQRRYADLRAAG